MYIVAVAAGDSVINGKGVFAIKPIPKGKIVWLYDKEQDLSVTQEDFATFNEEKKEWFYHSAYLSPWSGLWICPPRNDASNYTNHSADNNLSVAYDTDVSSEPYFIANRDIKQGEELTNNYHEFDKITQETNPDWSRV